MREIGDHKFTEFAEIPLFWLFAEAAVNPKYIAEYVFPGGDYWLLYPSGVYQAGTLSAAHGSLVPILTTNH